MYVIRQTAGGYGKWEEKKKDNFCFFYSFFYIFDRTPSHLLKGGAIVTVVSVYLLLSIFALSASMRSTSCVSCRIFGCKTRM